MGIVIAMRAMNIANIRCIDPNGYIEREVKKMTERIIRHVNPKSTLYG